MDGESCLRNKSECLNSILEKWLEPKRDWTKAQFANRLDEINGALKRTNPPLFHTKRYKLSTEKTRIVTLLEESQNLELDSSLPLVPELAKTVKKPAPSSDGKKRRLSLRKRSHGIVSNSTRTTCLACREVGHQIKSCPSLSTHRHLRCWKCGGEDHNIAECPAYEVGSTYTHELVNQISFRQILLLCHLLNVLSVV